MHFDLWTLGLQAANVLVLAWLLNRFLYRPILGVVAARQAAADKLISDVEAEKQKVEAQRRDLEARQAALAAERDRVLASAREAADADGRALLAKARAEADALRAEAGGAAAEERAEIARGLGRDAARLAVAIVRRLLDEDTTGAVQARQLDLACDDLASLPQETRLHIAERLSAGAETAEVVTAGPLDEAAAARMSQRLAEALGAPMSPTFKVDPALLAGVEIRFPFTILRRSWRESLKRVEAELLNDDRPSKVA